MVTVTPRRASRQPAVDHRPGVVRAALASAGCFVGSIVAILIAAGSNAISDETTRYSLTVLGMLCLIPLLTALIYILRRR